MIYYTFMSLERPAPDVIAIYFLMQRTLPSAETHFDEEVRLMALDDALSSHWKHITQSNPPSDFVDPHNGYKLYLPRTAGLMLFHPDKGFIFEKKQLSYGEVLEVLAKNEQAGAADFLSVVSHDFRGQRAVDQRSHPLLAKLGKQLHDMVTGARDLNYIKVSRSKFRQNDQSRRPVSKNSYLEP